MLIDWINKNNDTLLALHKAGLLSHTVFFYRNLYSDYTARVIMGEQKTLAVLLTADKFRISETTVYRAMKMMKSFIPDEAIAGAETLAENQL